MPLILLVEQDLGVVSRVRRAFSEQDGWKVQHVRTPAEAVDRAASEAPDLFVVAAEIPAAETIIAPFARRRGGPGTLAMVPAGAATPGDGSAAARLGADAVLAKPITEETVRRAAESILKAGERPAVADRGEPKLTSNDIFGDLVAEVEREAERRTGKVSAPPAAAQPPQGAPPTPAPSAGGPKPPEAAPKSVSPGQPKPEQGRPGTGRTPRPSLSDDDIERRLEMTLSGVLSGSKPRSKAPKTPATPGASRKGARSAEADLDELISKTLSGLELPKRKAPPRESAPGPREPAATEGAAASAASQSGGAPDGAPGSVPLPGPEAAGSAPPADAPGERPETVVPELEVPELDLPEIELQEIELEPILEEPPAEAAAPSAWDAEASAPAEAASGSTAPASAPGAEERSSPSIPFRPAFADTVEEMPEPLGGVELEGDGALLGAEASGDFPRESPGASQGQPGTPGDAASLGEGAAFGQYRLLERIGVGGMAEVWKARMSGVEGFQKMVAIKKILPHLTDSSDFVEMFIDEAKLAAQLNHANIIHIYDLGKIDGDYYIAMEYVDGENLRAILNTARDQGRPLPVGLALYIAARLASALDHAHRKRDFEDRSLDLVHRDVSPQNVLVGYEGTIKLCDFGIVKAVSKSSHTRMGALKGKLQYMSPEQAWGRSVDARSDIFAVGILLFEMLTGMRLFRGESEMEVLEAVRESRVRAPGEIDPSVPREVDAIVLKALSKDPEKRYQSAGELVRRLEEALVGMRPSPGQAELADYMGELFARGAAAAREADDSSEAAFGSAPGWVEAEAPAVAPAADSQVLAGLVEEPPLGLAEPPSGADPLPDRVPRVASTDELVGEPGAADPEPPIMLAEDAEPAPERPAHRASDASPATASRGAGTHAPLVPPGPPATAAVEPLTEVDLEEGGGRGKGLLVAAIVAALLIAVLLYWFVWRPRQAGESTAAPPSAPTSAPSSARAARGAPEEARPAAVPELLETAAPGEGGLQAEAGDAEGDAPAAAQSLGPEDVRAVVEKSIEEELARKEEELRRQFEAKERELAERLAAAERRAQEPAPETPRAEGEPPPGPSPRVR